MRKFKQNQFGGVTILLVILVGVAVMVATASLAYSINSKKEASVAAHAQTNAQMMAWAGTSAFYEYIKAKGATSLDDFKALNATSVTLKNSGGQEVIAKNISITGACAADGDLCEISADISAKNAASKAANTVNVRYKMRVQDGTVVPVAKFKASFGGDVLVDGKIIAEAANTDAEITVKGGDLWLNAGAQVNNFANLTFNVEGNVIIHCTASNCGNVGEMDINAGGYIYITDTGIGKFGDLNAKKYIQASGIKAGNLKAIEYVNLNTGSSVGNIQAGGNINLDGGAGALRTIAKNVESNGDVKVSWSTADNVYAKGSVAVTNGGTTKDIWSNENVTVNIAGTTVNGNIKARGFVNVKTGPNLNVNGSITAGGANTTTNGASVYVSGVVPAGGVKVSGEILTNGYVEATYGAINGVTTTGDVNLGLSDRASSGVNGGGGNINAGGSVFIGGNTSAVGNVNAVGNVRIGTSSLVGSKGAVGNIHSGGTTQMYQGSTAGIIEAVGGVTLGTSGVAATSASATDIYSGSTVELYQGSSAASIVAQGQVILGKSSNNKGNVSGAINAKGNVYVWQGSDTGAINSQATVRVHSGLIGDKSTTGNICAASVDTSKIALLNYYSTGSTKKYPSQCTFTLPTAPAAPAAPAAQNVVAYTGVDTQAIQDEIDEKFDFNNNVDVRVYKNEANYIFTKANKITRVYLNKLKDPATGNIYSYKMDSTDSTFKQYEKIAGVDTLVGDGGGFYLGKYTLGGTQKYVGAICKSVANGSCTSDIVAYLPRVSAEDQPSGTALETLNYTTTGDGFWQVKNFFQNSTIDNATIAPGIFYFEGELRIHGNPNIQSDPTSNAYTNTFLAEGDITALVVSPRIYSPYNILRVKSDASVICNRNLAQANGTMYTSAPSTTPTSSGFKYLIPTNLCKNDTQFAYNMDRDPATNQRTIVVIDWKNVPKLDLGYVALMSNKVVRLGTCSQIFGDVLARERIEVTGACGATSEQQVITGNITTQNASGSGNDNLLPAGGKWVLPKEEFSGVKGPGSGGGGGGTGITVDSSSIEMTWAKSL